MKALMILFAFFMVTASCRIEPESAEPDLSTGLVAHWNFDSDEPGIVKDASGNQLHGTAYDVDYAAGMIGRSVLFSRKGSKIVFPDIGQPPPQKISGLRTGSIALWFRFSGMGAQILPMFYFGESDTGSVHNSLIIEIGHGGGANPANKRLYFTIINRNFCFDSGINLQENTWHHFVAVVSEQGNSGFLDGAEMTGRNYNLGSDASFSDFFADVPVQELLAIGYGRYGQEDPFFSFNGNIDEVRIYDRPLAADEIVRLSQSRE
jgi:hypothetical protein